jgi:hypothetical protein
MEIMKISVFADSSYVKLQVIAGLMLAFSLIGAQAQQASADTTANSGFVVFEAQDAGSGAYQGTIATSINAAGEVTGLFLDAQGVSHGFVRTANGVITEFDAPNAGYGPKQGTFPVAINDSGVIAGTYNDANRQSHGFIRSANGTFTSFDAPGVQSPGPGTVVTGINASGSVTGWFQPSPCCTAHSFLRTAGGAIFEFVAPGAAQYGTGTEATSINADGVVTGAYWDSNNIAHGFVRSSSGAMTQFAVSTNIDKTEQAWITPQTIPLSIDADGNVAGLYEDLNRAQHAFLRTANGAVKTIDAPGGASNPCPEHLGGGAHLYFCGTGSLTISATNGMVGAFVDADDLMHGYIRSVSGDFSTFDAPAAGKGVGSGYQGTAGFGVNATGLIVGDYLDTNLVIHSFIYTPGALAVTTTTLTSSHASSIFDEPVTLTAKVSSSSSTPPNGGFVTFVSGTVAIGTERLSGGKAELTTTALPVETQSITAVYGGDLRFEGSTSKGVNLVVNKADSTTTLSAKPSSATSGEEVSLKATVSGQFGSVASGSVTFYDGEAVLGKETLSASRATFVTSKLSVGKHSIKAVYAGSKDLKTSDSETITVEVTK